MSSTSRSRWRQEAHRILQGVLAGLGPRATDAELERAVCDAWPREWGKRENHPYKMWCAEAREMLAEYVARRRVLEDSIAIVVLPRLLARATVAEMARAYIERCRAEADFDPEPLRPVEPADAVDCVYCNRIEDERGGLALRGGCISCMGLRERWAAAWAGRDAGAWVLEASRDAIAAAVLGDFLEEQGWPEEAAWVREHWPLKPKAKKKRRRKAS